MYGTVFSNVFIIVTSVIYILDVHVLFDSRLLKTEQPNLCFVTIALNLQPPNIKSATTIPIPK